MKNSKYARSYRKPRETAPVIPHVPAEEEDYSAVKQARILSRNNEAIRQSKNAKLGQFQYETRRRAVLGLTVRKDVNAGPKGEGKKMRVLTEYEMAFEKVERELASAMNFLAECS
jgi:hypothetical protein